MVTDHWLYEAEWFEETNFQRVVKKFLESKC